MSILNKQRFGKKILLSKRFTFIIIAKSHTEAIMNRQQTVAKP
jgi:hypothetical protein